MTNQARILDLIETLRTEGRPFCVVTVVRTANATSARAGAKAVVSGDGALCGYVGGACVTGAVRRSALQAIRSGQARMIRIKPREQASESFDDDGTPLFGSSCPSGGTVDVFLEPMEVARRLLVCGSSPVAQALVGIARALGMYTIVAVDQNEPDGLPGADRCICGFDLTTLELQPEDAVAVVTQGKGDREALRASLHSAAGYVAMVGSRRKIGRLKEQLAAELPAQRLAQLRGPAGIDIGAIAPEEIALSIAAEIVAYQRRRDL